MTIKCVCTSNSLQVNSSGYIIPCCKYLNKSSLPHISEFNNLLDFFQSSEVKNLKKSLDKDKFPYSCTRCAESEKINSRSRREFLLSQINIDNNEYFLDLNLGNVCNLKCRMCGPECSSMWHKETKDISKKNTEVLHLFRENTKPYIIKNSDIDKIIDFIKETNGKFNIEFKGGEPLIMESTEYFFNLLYQHDLIKKIKVLDITTNGTRSKPDWFDKVANDFEEFVLNFSIDGKNEIFDIIRGGNFISYDQVLKNYKTFNNEKIIKTINVVVQNYNVHQIPELYIDLKKLKPDSINLSILFGPDHLKANVMPENSRLKILDYYRSEYVKNILGNNRDYNSIIKILETPCTDKRLNNFYIFNNTLDKLRTQQTKDVVPHLFIDTV